MTLLGSDEILTVFILFCRIGACLMLMPGFSSERVPAQVRLFLALTVTLALTPLLSDTIRPALADSSATGLGRTVASEMLTGALIGFMGRIFFVAVETLAVAIAMATGLGNVLGAAIDENESLPAISSLITLAATALLFITDQHWEVLRGLVTSYDVWPVTGGFSTRLGLGQVAGLIGQAFIASLRISSPFLAFGIVVNMAVGLANRLTPQIQVYFISTPFVIAGGLFLIYVTCKSFLDLFVGSFAQWLLHG